MRTWMAGALLGLGGTIVPQDLAPSTFAAPHVIVLAGGPLARRVTMTDWQENMALLLATQTPVHAPHDSLAGRPRIAVAMFWGAHWEGRKDLPEPAAGSALPGGVQDGSFYPSLGDRPAIWVFGGIALMRPTTRSIQARGLELLTKHGIPTRVIPPT
jgi:hypothetical protein